MWKWIAFYTIAFILGIIIAIYELPFWIAIAVLILISLSMISNVLYTIYGTDNMKKAEKYIISKKKEPIYGFLYAQGFGTIDEQIWSIETILHKYKQPHIQHYYRSIQFLLKGNLESALNEAEKIPKEPLMSYTKALIHASMGNEKEALSYSLPKQWMQESILAAIAHYNHQDTAFENHVNKAISSARGIQRLSLSYSFEQMRKSL